VRVGSGVNILRATIFHTPANPFTLDTSLVTLGDGALAIEQGRIVRCSDYSEVAAEYPDAAVRDLRGGYIIPGLVDTHVHFPQVRMIGGLGYSLLDWLDRLTLPEEARLSDVARARTLAGEFVNALASHGTTTALVFGSHFAEATAALFSAAEAKGLRVFSGLVMADRNLRPELHQTPEAAYGASRALIGKFHGKGRLGYAVTPRFALSSSDAMLEAAGSLLREDSTLRFTTHINENTREIEETMRSFPAAADYLAIYEAHGLVGRSTVLAHNIHTSDEQLDRLRESGASIAHCPCSNAALGSGVFGLRRHLDHGVRVALGTDVGGGIGFGMMKEALQVYLQQRVAESPVTLSPAQMLYLATRAGAEALLLDNEIGDFSNGKAADLVYLKPPAGSVLAGVLSEAETPDRILGALFAMAGSESVAEVQVAGDVIYRDVVYK
jgi:guanine deaminase